MAGDGRASKDLRYLFMRGLIDHEKSQRSRHYLKSAAECTSRAIVSLELSPEPITTVKQAKRLEGIGGETCTRLGRIDEDRNFSSLKPLYGRYVSSAGALLVTLLDMREEQLAQGNDKDILIPESRVKIRARQLCEELFIEDGQEGFCVAWWRLEVLIKRGHVKRRSQKKVPCLQLLPAGTEIANRLRGPRNLPKRQETKAQTILNEKQQNDQIDHSLPPIITLSGNLDKPMETSLYTNDTGKDGLVLLVDTQEMGGERAGLGELCRLLEHNGVCYRTRKLTTGDYGWFWRHGGQEITLPCLAERKRADFDVRALEKRRVLYYPGRWRGKSLNDDVLWRMVVKSTNTVPFNKFHQDMIDKFKDDIPCTLKDGRFWSQINKMMDWRRGFTDRGVDCHIHYILERKPEEYVVKCTDGCQGIGRCGNPTLAQVKMVIEDLKHHPELLVKETDSLEITAILLKSLTDELKERTRKGDFDILKIPLANDLEDKFKTEIDTNKDELGANKLKTEMDTIQDELGADEAKTEIDTIQHELEIDLSYEEQLKIALANSLKDVKEGAFVTDPVKTENDFDKTDSPEKKNESQNTSEKILHEPSTSTSKSFQNQSSNSSMASSDVFVKRSMTDGPLMQHHCTVESSVTCQGQSGLDQSGDFENEYRPRINRKRSHVSLLSTLETLTNASPSCSDDLDSVKKPCKIPGNVSGNKIDVNSTLSGGSLNKEMEKKHIHFLGFGINTNTKEGLIHHESIERTKSKSIDPACDTTKYKRQQELMDDTADEILQSFRKRYNMDSTSDISVIKDEIVEKFDYKPPKRLKQIKLNLTPSKLFLETNIVMVESASKENSGKRKSIKKLEGAFENSLESSQSKGLEEPLSGKDTQQGLENVINKMSGTGLDLLNTPQSDKTNITPHGTVWDQGNALSHEDDNNSIKSTEDIFADTSSQELETNPINTSLENAEDLARECVPSEHDSKVNDWLTLCNPSGTHFEVHSNSIVGSPSIHSENEETWSNVSLPDIVEPKLEPGSSDNDVNTVNVNSDTLSEDDAMVISSEPSGVGNNGRGKSKQKQNGRRRNNSVDPPHDVHNKANSVNSESAALEAKIATVLAVLPQMKKSKVKKTLQRCGYNVEQCISLLLDEGVDENEPVVVIDLTD